MVCGVAIARLLQKVLSTRRLIYHILRDSSGIAKDGLGVFDFVSVDSFEILIGIFRRCTGILSVVLLISVRMSLCILNKCY